MEITGTREPTVQEKEIKNRLFYRKLKARNQGYVCPKCGKSYWIPNITNNPEAIEMFFSFTCIECGCEWDSSYYDVDDKAIEFITNKINNPVGFIKYQVKKNKFMKKIKTDMKTLEDGYNPNTDYVAEYNELLRKEENSNELL